MSESATIYDLASKFGVAGLLFLCVWFLAKEFRRVLADLRTAHEARIAALESAVAKCEADRIELRNLILQRLVPK